MSFKMKLVGNLVFDQEDGEIIHARTAETLAKYASVFGSSVAVRVETDTIAIDSTGVKVAQRCTILYAEILKLIKKIVLDVWLGTPTATDATVRVGLWDETAAEYIAYKDLTGTGGRVTVEVTKDLLAGREGDIVQVRVEVIAASATAGATQDVNERILSIIYDFT